MKKRKISGNDKILLFPRFLFKMVKLYRNIEKTVVGGKDAEYFFGIQRYHNIEKRKGKL